jgi:hypothetical protein
MLLVGDCPSASRRQALKDQTRAVSLFRRLEKKEEAGRGQTHVVERQDILLPRSDLVGQAHRSKLLLERTKRRPVISVQWRPV